jgi:hypothetical protein
MATMEIGTQDVSERIDIAGKILNVDLLAVQFAVFDYRQSRPFHRIKAIPTIKQTVGAVLIGEDRYGDSLAVPPDVFAQLTQFVVGHVRQQFCRWMDWQNSAPCLSGYLSRTCFVLKRRHRGFSQVVRACRREIDECKKAKGLAVLGFIISLRACGLIASGGHFAQGRFAFRAQPTTRLSPDLQRFGVSLAHASPDRGRMQRFAASEERADFIDV